MRLLNALTLALLCACGGCRKVPADVSQNDAGTDPCMLVEKGWGAPGATQVKVETVASGLEVPWGIAFLPGGDALVTERPGRVRLLSGGALVPDPVATVSIASEGEGGLLGIAAHPDFASNRQFYVYVTTEASGQKENRIERWVLSEDHRAAQFDKVIFGGIPSGLYHDGGRLRFGPDGMLYAGTGDAREPSNAQRLDTPSGKLLRLTPEGAVPEDNPYPGKPVYLLGIRNLQAFDWKSPGTLYLADHGPSGELSRLGHDEVDVANPGQNLGWPDIYSCEARAGMVTPSLVTAEAMPPGGGAIYTGDAIPEWRGSFLIGTLNSRHLHRVVFDGANPRKVAQHEVYFQGDAPAGYGRLREVVMGPDKQLYVTTSNCDGRGACPADKDRILRITR